jgi:hypothetical protein
MIRARYLSIALLALPMIARAQFDPARYGQQMPWAWLVVSDGVGPNGGGVAGTTGLSQMMRAAAVVPVYHSLGFETGVLRLQEIIPAVKVANDRVQNDPRADGAYLSLAQFSREGSGRGIPGMVSFGGGVMRRPTNTPGDTRLTSGIVMGVESQLADPLPGRMDMSAGLKAVLMPGGNHRQIYVLALFGGLRLH